MSSARAILVELTGDVIVVALSDGRTISAPLAWFPRLLHGEPVERANFQMIGNGSGIHWPDLDEDISVEGLLTGRRSAESSATFKRWLSGRGKKQS